MLSLTTVWVDSYFSTGRYAPCFTLAVFDCQNRLIIERELYNSLLGAISFTLFEHIWRGEYQERSLPLSMVRAVHLAQTSDSPKG